MFKEERHLYILKQLETDGRVVCRQLAAALKVSADTIIRDLKELAEAKKLLKVHGGALPLEKENLNDSYNFKTENVSKTN